MLSAVLAQEIARDTSAVIGHNVLITDDAGVVIGSGDEARVGGFHEASVEVMRTQQPRTHSLVEAGRLRGVKPGITLPIVIDGVAVGTVGITGAPDRVRRFGLVVKRQTEILLQESATLRTRLQRERAFEDLLRDVATFDADLVEADLVRFRARELGIDLTLPRVAVAVEVRLADEPPEPGPARAGSARRTRLRSAPASDVSVLRSELLRTARGPFPDPQDLVSGMASGRLVILHRMTAAGVAAVTPACRRLVAAIASRHGLLARAAVGDPADSIAGLHDSYQDAVEALRLGARVAAQETVHTIEDLRIYQAMAAVGPGGRSRLTHRVCGPLREQADWPALRQTVIAWSENGLNLVRTAGALHIHRNTLVYRLAKVEQILGRSLRDGPTALALYLACLADQLDAGQGGTRPASVHPSFPPK